ncbi:MAG TPA: bifunctional diaminohydroxyphosphoribosylaminopyrimidine deaminase/5-amino-6-(5-phosphoribosylamino)uracil reductase RibD [Chthoniobacterales bacterium]|jgi:diaminohydroxyphosphoribosylaminopyrimidine deaminase/5-amino-6-(5-phosphoribosylamino)uracil reductase
MSVDLDEKFMRLALAEASKGIGQVSPNPAVGAILVHNGHVIARGYHRASGLPHAEVECLAAAGGHSLGKATLYVTLEPCSTTGRTPPCTAAIARAGLKRIVIGAIDKNPAHHGRAVDELRAAGIQVSVGVLGEDCARLNEAFNHWIVTGRPFVIAKCGMSLDGRLTRLPNESRWITSAAARRHARQLRAEVDAILIGAETLRRDNPRLTSRGIRGAKQPRRVVLSRSGNLPETSHLFTDRFAARTLVYRRKKLQSVLEDLGRKEVTSVLIEGGGNLLSQAFAARLVDKVQFYVAPLFTGGPVPAVGGRGAASTGGGAHLRNVHYERIGSDLCVSGYPRWADQAE